MATRATAERYIAKVMEVAEDIAEKMNVPAQEITISVHVRVSDRVSGSWPPKGGQD